MPAAGGREQLLLASPQEKTATDWSADGEHVLFDSRDFNRLSDIWALPMNGSGKPFPVVNTDFEEVRAQFSPDGPWIAYQSDESGRPEIYLQRFPGAWGKQRVSTNGGSQVRWRRNGSELFCVAPDGRLMAVRVGLRLGVRRPDLGTPVELFATTLGGAMHRGDHRHQYAVASDGQRFLVATVGQAADASITVILNWTPRP
ncbi:MAG: PD40 domain-containing protein [Chloroflexi bacterium]|nr:PD40 domain-containing protein [Chloroflexota bacterium]